MEKKAQVLEIPATEQERNKLMGSSVTISSDIIAELTIQTRAYLGMGLDKARELSMNALKKYGSDKVKLIDATQHMIEAGDFGYRL